MEKLTSLDSAPKPAGSDIDIPMRCVEGILCECQRCPGDSVRDIANDMFAVWNVDLAAEWTDDDDCPITLVEDGPDEN